MPGNNYDPDDGIWYAWDQGDVKNPHEEGTLYIQTFGQKNNLSEYCKGCTTGLGD